jgi:hypothetical protein
MTNLENKLNDILSELEIDENSEITLFEIKQIIDFKEAIENNTNLSIYWELRTREELFHKIINDFFLDQWDNVGDLFDGIDEIEIRNGDDFRGYGFLPENNLVNDLHDYLTSYVNFVDGDALRAMIELMLPEFYNQLTKELNEKIGKEKN